MALLQRCVEFKGINTDIEDQKTERRAEKLRRKKERKMATLTRNEDIRYFLYCLQTVDPDDLRRQMSDNEEFAAQLTLLFPRRLFPNLPTPANKLDAFARVVSTLTLPDGKKAEHHYQMEKLGGLMDMWVRAGVYDMDLDRFSQHLRVLSGGQDALEAHFEGVFPQERAAAARQMAQLLRAQGGIGRVRASAMPEALKTHLRELKNHMKNEGSYDYGDSAIRTASSGESSDDSDVEESFCI
jgi:hypothetical protein